MNGDPLEALKTPLGAFEPNVLLAGLEGSLAAWLGFVLITDGEYIPKFLTQEWHWSIAVWALLLLATIVLVGLLIEGLAGALERLITWTSFNSYTLRPWFSTQFQEPDPGAWREAQRWIWKSDQAGSEFARRRLRLLTARNTAFVFFAATVSIAIGLFIRKPAEWLHTVGIVLVAGVGGTIMFLWVWVGAQRAYNRAVQDALRAGPP